MVAAPGQRSIWDDMVDFRAWQDKVPKPRNLRRNARVRGQTERQRPVCGYKVQTMNLTQGRLPPVAPTGEKL